MPGARVTSGDRVTLRTAESEDGEFLQQGNEPDIRYPMGSRVRTLSEIEDTVEDSSDDRFVVCLVGEAAGSGPVDPDDVRRIGFVSVEDADWKRPELAYWLLPEVHGEGYETESLTLAIDYAFRAYDAPPSVRAHSGSPTPLGACSSHWALLRRAAASSCSPTPPTGTWFSTVSSARSGPSGDIRLSRSLAWTACLPTRPPDSLPSPLRRFDDRTGTGLQAEQIWTCIHK